MTSKIASGLKLALHCAVAGVIVYFLSMYILTPVVKKLPSGVITGIAVVGIVAALAPIALSCVRTFRQGVADAEAEIALGRTGRKDSEH